MAYFKAEMFNYSARKDVKTVLDSLSINQGDVIADIGSGGGFFTFELAKRTGPSGIVFAADTDLSLLSYIKRQRHKKKIFNIVTIEAGGKDTNLLACCDLIFMRDVFHHINNPSDYFQRLKNDLKPNGRVAIIDWKPESRGGHGTPEKQILIDMENTGYKHVETFDFLEKQSFNIFKINGFF
jgi:SAM-dependent methyltransferase